MPSTVQHVWLVLWTTGWKYWLRSIRKPRLALLASSHSVLDGWLTLPVDAVVDSGNAYQRVLWEV